MSTNQLLAECKAWKKRALEAEKELKEVRELYRSLSDAIKSSLCHIEELLDKLEGKSK